VFLGQVVTGYMTYVLVLMMILWVLITAPSSFCGGVMQLEVATCHVATVSLKLPCVQPREDRVGRPLRAAYHGHVLELAEQLDAAEKQACATGDNGLASAIQLVSGWEKYMAEIVQPRLQNSRREAWQAPMPSTDGEGILQEDFTAAVDIPETYPNISENLSSSYEMVRPSCPR
jgi:hypothetical protein